MARSAAGGPPATLDKVQGRLSHVLAALVLIQAAMAGHSGRLSGGPVDIEAHGIVGHVTFLVSIASFVLALVGRVARDRLVVAGLLLGLIVAQVGLGFTGRSSGSAAAWHVPNGVLIFGLAVYGITRASRR